MNCLVSKKKKKKGQKIVKPSLRGDTSDTRYEAELWPPGADLHSHPPEAKAVPVAEEDWPQTGAPFLSVISLESEEGGSV